MVSGDAIHSDVPSGLSAAFPEEADFFKGLPQDDIRALAAAARLRNFAKGEHIFLQEAPASSVFVITGGWVRLYRSMTDGSEATPAVMTRGGVFGEGAFFEPAYRNSAQAVSDAEVIELPAALLAARAKASPVLAMHVAALLSSKLEDTRLEAEHVALKTTLQRVGCLLLKLTARMNGAGGAFPFPYDKKIAAQQLGMQRETFSRALAGLKGVGVTTSGSEVRIDDFERLTAYACRNCSAYPNRCPGPRVRTSARGFADKLLLIAGGAWCDAYSGILEFLMGVGGEA